MSINHTAVSLIGVRIRVFETMLRLTEEACSHRKPIGAKFCPECGKPAHGERIPIHPVALKLKEALEAESSHHDYLTYLSADGGTIYYGVGIFIGLAGEGSFKYITTLNLKAVENSIYARLQKVSVPNIDLNQSPHISNSFGLHAFLDVRM